MPLILAYLVTGAAIAALFYATKVPAGRQALAHIAGNIAAWGLQTLFYVAPTIAVGFAEALVSSFDQDRELWARVTSIFVKELTGEAPDPAALAAGLSAGALGSAAPAVGKPIIDAVLQVVGGGGAIAPEDGQKNLERLLGITMALSLQGWFLSASGDLISLGKFGAAADLPDAVERGLGLSRIGRLAWRAPIKKAIEEPLTIALNRQYLATRLTVGMAAKAWHRGDLDDAAFREAAADAGFSPDRADVLLADAAAPLLIPQVRALVKYQGLDQDSAIALLRKLGYAPDVAASILALEAAQDEQHLLDEIATNARKLYRDGQLSADEYKSFLAEAHLTDAQVQLAQVADDLALRVEKQLTVVQLEALLAAGLLSPADFRARMQALRYQAADVDLLVAQHTKRISPNQVVAAFIRGGLDEAAALAQLQTHGYSAADAQTLLTLHGKRLSEGQVLDALRQGLITTEEARGDLQALGFDAPQVDLLLAFHRRTLSPADVQAALVGGAIEAPEALARLRAAGYSADDAQHLLALHVRKLTEGQLLDAYARGVLSRPTVLQDLLAHGLAQPDALVVLAAFDAKHAAAVAKGQAAAAAAQARAVAAAQKAGTPPQSPVA